MFGYMIPEKPELKIREYEVYRAHYCGVCRAIKKNHGNLPRLTLNYDTTFLALLLSALFEEEPNMEDCRCAIHPLKRRKMITNSEILSYAADMNVLLSWLNLADKWEDDKSRIAYAGMLALKPAYLRVTARYPEKSRNIHEQLEVLSQLEANRCDSIDQAAEPFAKLMEEVILYPSIDTGDQDHERNKRALPWLGYHIGKWIYTIDALDDVENDIRSKSYNPFLYQYWNREAGISDIKDDKDMKEMKDISDLPKDILDAAEFNLFATLSEIAKIFELLQFKRHKDIIGNIIYLGMQRKTETILRKGKQP